MYMFMYGIFENGFVIRKTRAFITTIIMFLHTFGSQLVEFVYFHFDDFLLPKIAL